MISPATGMKAGERYAIDSAEGTQHFSGFFLDGKYYLGADLLTAVGWLEGQDFYYDELDASGDPAYPGQLAGTMEDLTLTMVDGTSRKLTRIDFHAVLDAPSDVAVGRSATYQTPSCAMIDDKVVVRRQAQRTGSVVVVAAAAGLLVGVLLAAVCSGRRG